MADLRERGQIMLISAFVLAVSFLALAVMLNSVIYTENLATRGEDARGTQAVEFRADAVEGTEQLIEYVNDNQTSKTFNQKLDDLNRSIQAMSNGTAPIQAVDGLYTSVSPGDATNGTVIGQFNATGRDFTSDSGDTNWDISESYDINGARSFRMNITGSSKLADTSGANFTVQVDNGTSQWDVQIYNETSSDTAVAINGNKECSGGSNPEIDLTAGTIDGARCEELDFGDGVSAPYNISFRNATNIQGNFSLVVNSTTPDNSDSNYDSSEGTPFAADAIYAATIHVYHESASHIYETDARAIPGENDE